MTPRRRLIDAGLPATNSRPISTTTLTRTLTRTLTTTLRRTLAATLAATLAVATAVAQDSGAPLPGEAAPAASLSPPVDGVNAVDAVDAAETVVAPSAEERSRILRENLQQTIEEGERVLRSLPKERLRVLRARLSNLDRQLKRKEAERSHLQDSLATLRADYFRRLGALRRDGESKAVIAAEERRLKEDYDLHAEFFEDEVEALDRDVTEIRETMRSLEARSEIEERALPQPPPTEREPSPSDSIDALPAALNPFEFRSYLPLARGRRTAPREVLLGLRAEAAFRQGRLTRAASALDDILAERLLGVDARVRSMSAYNRAMIDYVLGNYSHAYRTFREHFDTDPEADLDAESAHVLAVLAYMNGFMDRTRAYLRRTDDESRRKVTLVLGSIDTPAAR